MNIYQIIKKYLIFFILLNSIIICSGCSNKLFIKDLKYTPNVYPMFGKTPVRTFSVSEDIGDSLKLKWKNNINGSFGPTSITALGQYIIVPDLSGRIYAFNIDKGQKTGEIKYKGEINKAAIVDGTFIIFSVTEKNSNKSAVYYYDLKTGAETKKIIVEGRIQPEMIFSNEEVIYITEEGLAGKISFKTGEKIWAYDTKAFLHSSPVMVNNSVIFGDDKGAVYSIDQGSGKLNYKKSFGKGFEGGFSAAGDTVYTSDNTGRIFTFIYSDGKVIWELNSGTKINTVPVIDKGFVYFNNLRGEILKLDKSTGKLAWRIATGDLLNITPLVFNDYVVQPDLNKKVYFINKNTGKINKIIKFENRVKLTPVFYKNILFLGTDNGQVYAYEPVKF